MAKKLYIDFESRSAVDLSKSGVHRYAENETTSILCMAYAFDDEDVLVTDGLEMPDRVREHVTAGRMVIAHNFAFERTLWNAIGVKRAGWPELKLEQGVCTMARAYAMALPGSLEKAAAAVGLDMQKDLKGQRLMMKLCKPKKNLVDGKLDWYGDKEDFEKLKAYCAQDVLVERALDKRLLALSPKEKEVWRLDQVINDRGIRVDLMAANTAIEVVDFETRRLNDELKEVSGNRISTYNAHSQIKEFIEGFGLQVSGVTKADVLTLLERRDLPPQVRRVLEIRQEAAKSSTRKLQAMVLGASEDERLKGMFQYHGAGTGRWAGRRVQLQNLPRNIVKQDVIDTTLNVLQKNRFDDAWEFIRNRHGSPISIISQSLRGFLIASPGKKLMAMDWSAIEARVLAWIAGQESVLEVFRTHAKIYEQAASEIFGIAIDKVSAEQRQVGKVAVLALGYQGGVGALQAMAKAYGIKLAPALEHLWNRTDKDTREYAMTRWSEQKKGLEISKQEWLASELTKTAWRKANPEIVNFWGYAESAAFAAIQSPNTTHAIGNKIMYLQKGSFLFCKLPSGRNLCYPYPKVENVTTPWGTKKWTATYMAQNSMTGKWERQKAYGGLLVENITQAVARDLLAEAIVFLEKAHWPVVAHVHDEIVVEVDQRERLEDFKEIVGKWAIPEWAAGLPMSVEGWEGLRYKK